MSRGPARTGAILAALAAVLLILSTISLATGPASATIADLFRPASEIGHRVLVEIRLPRLLLAILVGASLSVAGATSQALLGSPLADPFTLGISGGAALGAAVASLFALREIPGGLGGSALLGAAGAAVLVYAASRRTGRLDTARLLLAGLVANALFSALILLALSAARGDTLRGMVFWMMGSLGGAALSDVLFLAPYAALGLTILIAQARPLDLFLAGEESAASLGVDVERTKRLAFFAMALLTAAAVASAGIIGFVGLLVPHAARRLAGSAHRSAIPAAALLGASTVVAADLASRALLAPTEIPIGALSALVGAPFLLALLFRRENEA